MYKRSMIDFFDFIGLVGVVLSVFAYARVQWRREYAKELGYSVYNFLGASFLIIALCNKWNVASFVGNVIWATVSLYGIYRCMKYFRRSAAQEIIDPLGPR